MLPKVPKTKSPLFGTYFVLILLEFQKNMHFQNIFRKISKIYSLNKRTAFRIITSKNIKRFPIFFFFFDDAHFEKKKNSPPTPSSTKTISPSRMTTTTISRWLGLWADSESPNHFRLFQRGRGHFYAQCKKLVSCQGCCFYVDLSMFFIFFFFAFRSPLVLWILCLLSLCSKGMMSSVCAAFVVLCFVQTNKKNANLPLL